MPAVEDSPGKDVRGDEALHRLCSATLTPPMTTMQKTIVTAAIGPVLLVLCALLSVVLS